MSVMLTWKVDRALILINLIGYLERRLIRFRNHPLNLLSMYFYPKYYLFKCLSYITYFLDVKGTEHNVKKLIMSHGGNIPAKSLVSPVFFNRI